MNNLPESAAYFVSEVENILPNIEKLFAPDPTFPFYTSCLQPGYWINS